LTWTPSSLSVQMGRVAMHSVPWTDVVKVGRGDDGRVGVQKNITSQNRWPIWEIQIWEGKPYKTPHDKTRLDLVSVCIHEALSAVKEAERADTLSAYEELRKRRGN